MLFSFWISSSSIAFIVALFIPTHLDDNILLVVEDDDERETANKFVIGKKIDN